jgi:hypothetical protein
MRAPAGLIELDSSPKMPAQPDPGNVSVGQFAERIRREMIPLRKPFSYYFADLPLTEEDIREYLVEPIAALPPSVLSQLPKVSILLVPYLERAREKGAKRSGELVRLQPPSEDRVSWTSCVLSSEGAVLAFALKEQEVADYHYHFYHLLAALVADAWKDNAQEPYTALVRAELDSGVHGEVDEASWNLKQSLLHRHKGARRDTKLFREYARQSFIDTLTLYLHGICCDIDVETGPRQIASRYLRRRLQLLETLLPPPTGYHVFPEEARPRGAA